MSSSAKRALQLLSILGQSERPIGVTELARAIGSAPGTAFRGLDALHRANFIARQPSSSRYGLGPVALALRQSLIAQFPIRELCLPHLRQFASLSGETISLHVRVGWYAVRIATAQGTSEVTSGGFLRAAPPLGAGPAGRAILAHLDGAGVAAYLVWAKARGIDHPPGLKTGLGAIRAQGFAPSSRREEGGFALPIRKSDQAFAAIFSDGPGVPGAFPKSYPPAELRQIAHTIEALVRATPSLSHQPFEHVDADQIVLPS